MKVWTIADGAREKTGYRSGDHQLGADLSPTLNCIDQTALCIDQTAPSQLTLSVEDSPAKTSAWLDAVLDWLVSDPDFGINSIASLANSLPVGFLSRTSLAFYPATEEETLPSSFAGWSNSGMASLGGYLTLSTSEWPSDAAVCSLSDVLETGPVPPKYFLSPKACLGILRRAEKRGRELPPSLRAALEHAAQMTTKPRQGT